MINQFYFVGISLAIVSGIVNQLGTILMKDVVNQNLENPQFMKSLIKSPKWLAGLFLQLIVSGFFLYMIAQLFIGPALISGLMTSGLIVLAIGSVKILGETLKKIEFFGISLNIIGIFLLSFSGVSLDLSNFNILELSFLLRMIIFIIIILGIIFLFELVYRKFIKSGVILALESGILYSFVALWSSLITVSLGHLFKNTFQVIELMIFIPSLILVGLFITISIIYTQKTLKQGKANILSPLIGVPTQITPIVIHFLVFAESVIGILSLTNLMIGLVLIIVASFILGKRQTEIEKL